MSLEFKKITLEDQQLLQMKLRTLNCKLLNYNFTTLFIYRNLIHCKYALFEDFLIIKTFIRGKERFLFPVGNGDPEEAFNAINAYSFAKNGYCHFFQFCENNAKPLLKWADRIKEKGEIEYRFYENRGEFEYIYLTENLINLEGHKYKVKRNHVNHFLKNNSWSMEIIEENNLKEVINFSNEWDVNLNIKEDSLLYRENIALAEAFDHYFHLGIKGLLIRVNEKIVAFAIGNPLCDDTYQVLFEKADRNIHSSYAIINKEFARVIASDYTYINRAEDCGNEGLRKAKLSYNPYIIQQVFHIELNELMR